MPLNETPMKIFCVRHWFRWSTENCMLSLGVYV